MPAPQTPSPLQPQGQASSAEPLLRVLGSMSAQRDGCELPLGPPRRRALLGLLLIRLGRVVPTEILIDELWGDEPPRQPVATLQSHISHLRRVLDRAAAGQGQPSVLRYRAPGYVLGLAPEQVDVHRFEQLVSAGRTLLGKRDPLAAHERLTTALKLWRGSPYSEFSAHPALVDETTRLEQVRLSAVEFRSEAGLALGAADEVAGVLGAEVRLHPTRERLVGHLMTALSRLGRQAEALELYEQTRRLLAEEFGVDTAVELQRVHTAILRQESESEGTFSSSAPFVGRDRELRRLTQAAAAAATGHGHVACVTGSAGTGKTRLLLELRSRLENPQAELEVFTSQCFHGEGAPPYWLWTQVLRQLSAGRPDAFRAAAAPFGTLLAPLLPEQAPGHAPAEISEVLWPQARFRTHDAVCEVLFTLAKQRPLVLLVEDLHWADPASLELLRLLCSRRHSFPLSIVMSVRRQGPPGDAAMCRTLTEIFNGPRTEDLELDGLSLDSVAALVEAQAGPGVRADVVRTLHERSKGNPYFVVQFLSHLGDARRLHDPDAVDMLLAQIPVGVREVLRQRLSALPESVLRVLRLCAVIGPEVDTDLLRRTAPDVQPVATALDTVISEGLLNEDRLAPGRVSFTHALVQETLIDDLSPEDRQNLHARIAQELSVGGRARMADQFPDEEDEEAERIAQHVWHAKDAVPAPWALARLLRAAERAEHHRAYEQVETWLRRAAHVITALPTDDPSVSLQEQRLYIQLGRVLALTRGYGDHEAETALRRGLALNTFTHAPEDPSVLLTLCATQLCVGNYEDARTLSGRLRAVAATEDDPVAVLGAHYGDGVVLHIRNQLPEALMELERGIEAADRYAREGRTWRRALQVSAPVNLRSYEAFTLWLLGDREAAADRRRCLLRLAEHADSGPADRASALYLDAVIAGWEGDIDTAHASSTQGARLAAEHGLPYWQAMLGLPRGWALAHSGHEDEGITLMRESLAELERFRTRIRLPLHLGLLGQAQRHTGRLEDAEATMRRMVAIIERRQEHVYLHGALPTTRLLHEILGSRGMETTHM
ncbi:ATP-binding protein [Streptomyces niveus]